MKSPLMVKSVLRIGDECECGGRLLLIRGRFNTEEDYAEYECEKCRMGYYISRTKNCTCGKPRPKAKEDNNG